MKPRHNTGLLSLHIHITGLVQGVGFRPFVYRMAMKHGILGEVDNRNDGVHILAEGQTVAMNAFLLDLKTLAPPASEVGKIETEKRELSGFLDFRIVPSRDTSEEITRISPDIAVCDDCLADMKSQPNRIDYPFINCTNCGPRFTIIRDLPYDRTKTTMEPFIMCKQCRAEYEDVRDRRFHAQPTACSICGPKYDLKDTGYRLQGAGSEGDENGVWDNSAHNLKPETCNLQPLHSIPPLIKAGKIIALKSLGGFNLVCDALNEKAVAELRRSKDRDGKPFAVMFRDPDALNEYVFTSQEEHNLLTSWKRPIVILKTRKSLAYSVSVGFPTTGAMLPYMPMHHLMFEHLETPALVMTSGNISDEPIVTGNEEARTRLGGITRYFIDYNRDIHNRTDDSVAFICNGRERLIRRSRGYVPNPVEAGLDVDGIIGAGAELVNCFCIGKGRQAILSQHIGDLKNMETLEFYEESIALFKRLFRAEPQLIVCDLHPDYLSSRWAEAQGLELMRVQHHHAHVASCMAEHGLDEKVIGIAMDGVGLGDDGHIWGGEFFLCDFLDYDRVYHLDYVPQPGGDAATKHPWQMAVAYLYHYLGDESLDYPLPFLEETGREKTGLVMSALRHRVNCPLTSSTGRLFDAVAALTGICTESSFHAEAPMRLEAAISYGVKEAYDFELNNGIISLKPMMRELVNDILDNEDKGRIAAKFHNTVINIILAVSLELRKINDINRVVISGGTFQNRYLLEHTEKTLEENGFMVYSHGTVPSNDGGIALGQVMIAAKRRK